VKLPNGLRADIGTKLEEYVLNPRHREGKHKARVFESVLGITVANADVLRRALLQHAADSDEAEWRGDNGFGDVDNCPNDFNPAQSDGNGNGVGDVCDSGTPEPLTVTRVQLTANKPGVRPGTIVIKAILDSTEFGGVPGLSAALRQRLAVGVCGAGLAETQAVFFPPWCGTTACNGGTGPNGSSAMFFRKGSSNLFNVTLRLYRLTFEGPLSSSPVTVTLSIGDLDRRDTVSNVRTGRTGNRARARAPRPR
jgi:hypothetical protein